MALPGKVRVKLSSEAAEYIALTPVVVQEMDFLDLLEHVALAANRELPRVLDILKRGALASGGSRFRWEACVFPSDEIAAAMALLPHDEPERPFSPAGCARITLTGPAARIELPKEAVNHRRPLRRQSYWDSLLAEAAAPAYVAYDGRARADRYHIALTVEAIERLKQSTGLLTHSALAERIRFERFDGLDLLVPR
jgi:hypothetical protein